MKDRNWNANNSMAVSLHSLYSQSIFAFRLKILSLLSVYSCIEFNIFYFMEKTTL